ncbi:hypothetical protein ELZ88_24125 (plasmid) [Salmonella enterica subsp. enterica serovar Karamoja]|uniref:Uncharacterized protein n=1 Tax=Salmonella enterica subsp. enterica serovar Karamoja TaxID=2500153 RepID=A0A3Q9MXH6_SALET|nr:hypothetical protein [Salmonella enterica]AZT39635.1 hypothetical protein ELZ88_24125 [Salmonella enterica subsp. enterica serovar Karamoja]AZT44471.1 hypothetical protein EL007_24820 [Salmonella enterica subsp. enterica serovar Karamoja]
MPINDIAVLIFSFVALCVFVFCAANIVVQLKIHDLKCLLQDDYEKARRKLVKEWEDAGEKTTNEMAALKIEMKSLRNQLEKLNKPAGEDLSSAAVLGTKKKPDEDPQVSFVDSLNRNDILH